MSDRSGARTSQGWEAELSRFLPAFADGSDGPLVVELRALGVPRRFGDSTLCGFFDLARHGQQFRDEVRRLVEKPQDRPEGVYVTLNPVVPAIVSRAEARLTPPGKKSLATKDKEVDRRRWLLIDVDPVRPAGISATDEEKAKAFEVAENVRKDLLDRGWPVPLQIDSGNGYHLWYRIDLPADDGGLVERFLKALAAEYDTPAATVDASVFNPARIVKLPGTYARKGDDTADRPHRLARVLHAPAPIKPVSRDLIEGVAGKAPDPKAAAANGAAGKSAGNGQSNEYGRLRVEDWLRDRGVAFRVKDWLDSLGRTVYVLAECPFDPSHAHKDACIYQEPGGKLAASCKHNSCRDRGWKEFKARIGKPESKHYDNAGRTAAGPSANGTHQADGHVSGSPRAAKTGYSPHLYTSPKFFAANFPREFLVRGVLVKGQPAILGGPKKALKSSIAIDLAISLDTGTPFLGFDRFAVPTPVKVLLLNGESGDATIQETAVRVAQARHIDPSSLGIVWGMDLPQLTNAEHLRDLAALIRKYDITVVIIDPTYLCLLSGVRADGPQASNVLDMGPVYKQIGDVCLAAGATPILTSHAKKGRGHDPLDLDDLAYAGVAEFARQWVLVSRREDYQGDGRHQLWLNVGGSVGHSFLGHLDIEEGTIGDDFTGRTWKPTVSGYQEAKREQKSEREQEKVHERQADESLVMKMIDDMEKVGDAATKTRLREGSPLSRPRTDSALERLRQQRLIEEYTATVPKGNKASQDATAYRRIRTACDSL